ncbi:hypothetical protein Bca101_010210 [Brassica carinata]
MANKASKSTATEPSIVVFNDVATAKYEKLYQALYTKTNEQHPYEIVNGTTDVKPTPEDTKMDDSRRRGRTEEPKGFKLEFFFDSNPYSKYTVLTKSYHNIVEGDPLLEKSIRELGDISETTMAGALATAEGTKSLNSRV